MKSGLRKCEGLKEEEDSIWMGNEESSLIHNRFGEEIYSFSVLLRESNYLSQLNNLFHPLKYM